MKKLKLITLLLCLAFLDTYQAVAQTRLGLHYTDLELAEWQARTPLFAGADMYVATGDVSANSPGDWNRIVANKAIFNSNPAGDRYTNYCPGCAPVPQDVNGAYDPNAKGYNLRDAAFYYLVATTAGDRATTLANVRTELLWNANNANLDFSNRSRWVAGKMSDVNPGFVIAEWGVRMLYAYDYVKGGLSGGDKTTLQTWFLNFARYMQTNYDPDLGSLFVNRAGGNYSLSQAALNKQFGLNGVKISSPLPTYYGGPMSHYVSKFYSNRRHKMAAFAGLVGIAFNDALLINSGKTYYKEFVKFALYPDGMSSDIIRSIMEGKPDKGFNYGENSILYAFVDALARNGDTSMYTYSTSEGDTSPTLAINRSSDGSTQKNMKMNIKQQLDLGNHVGTARYASTTATSNVDLRIDWIDAPHGTNYAMNVLSYAAVNKYFKDTYFDQSIKKTYGGGGGTYPANPTKQGIINALMYPGMYPGASLMFVGTSTDVFGGTPAKTNQTITFAQPPAKTYGDAAFTPPASTTSGLTIAWTSSNTAVATVGASTGLITPLTAGTTDITASQAGNGSYFAAQNVTRTFTVNQAVQTIAFAALVDKISTASPFVLSATATSGLTVGFGVFSGPAYLGHDTLFLTGDAGVVTVRSFQGGNDNYLAAVPVVRTFNVTVSSPPSVTNLVNSIISSDTSRYRYAGTGQQQLQSDRWFVLPSPVTGYTFKKVTIPSGFGIPSNTVADTEMWIRNGSTLTKVFTFPADQQPIFEQPINLGPYNFDAVFFRCLGKSIPMRMAAGASGIKVEGL